MPREAFFAAELHALLAKWQNTWDLCQKHSCFNEKTPVFCRKKLGYFL